MKEGASMNKTTKCRLCAAVMPAARSALGTALGTAVFGTLGLKKSSDPVEQLVMFLVGLGLGHAADILVAEISRPICGSCQPSPRLAWERPRSSSSTSPVSGFA
jgi:hypothetical protein